MDKEIVNVPQQEQQAAKEGYIHRVLVASDQFANVVLRGRPDETISARSYRAALQGKFWGKVLSKGLNLIQKNHGADAAAGDLERSESIAATEKKVL